MTSPVPASFNVSKGIDGISMIPINASSVIAGNSNAVDIKLENQFVSRRHFQVRFESDVFYISDLSSANGTYLNGSKLNPNEGQILRDRVPYSVMEFVPDALDRQLRGNERLPMRCSRNRK